MPVDTESSFIADSTVSSSPKSTIDTPLQVKRAARTYGRRREDPQPLDTVQSYVEEPLSSRSNLHLTAPPGLSDEVPPSSPRHGSSISVNDDNDAVDGLFEGAPSFEFGWRKALRDIDELDDDEDKMDAAADSAAAQSSASFGQPSLLLEPTGETKSSRMTSESMSSESEGVFDANTSFEEQDSQADIPPLSSLPPPSSPPAAIPRSSRRHSRIVSDYDSGNEQAKESSPQSSPGKIFSPSKSGSSSTQPTSEDELPVNILTKSSSAGKQKATSANHINVPPLMFTSESTLDKVDSNTAAKSKKSKPPTKKDKSELLKERSRLAADTVVSIPKPDQKKWTKQHFLSNISKKHEKAFEIPVQRAAKSAIPTSDPIIPFSSPPKRQESFTLEPENEASSKSVLKMKAPLRETVRDSQDSDEDSDLPDVGEVIQKDLSKNKLLEVKKRALEQQKKTLSIDDDDDLEIVHSNPKIAVKEEEEHRRGARKRPSEARQRQLHLAKINPTKQSAKVLSAVSPGHRMRLDVSSLVSKKAGEARMSPGELSTLLAAEARKRALEETRRKEEEWKRHGGRVRSNPEGQSGGLATVLKTVAEKALDNPDVHMKGEEAEDDGSDEEWQPEERGSASPEPADDEESEEEADKAQSLADEDMEVDDEPEGHAKVRLQRRKVVESDSETENGNDENTPVTLKQLPSRSTSRELQTEEEEDKENNTQLMYDRSEDKENTAVVRHRPMASISQLSFGSDASPQQSPSAVGRNWARRDSNVELEDQDSAGHRQPFKELASEDSPLPRRIQPSNLTQTFAEKLQQASPLSTNAAASSSKNIKPVSTVGDVFGAPTLLGSSFSDLFDSTTQKQTSPTLKRANDTSKVLRRTDTLELTQDVSTLLQPAFEAKDTLVRKADAIFEKEQALLLESTGSRESLGKKPTLYINDNGFLTQTRPADGSPEVYVPSPSQALRAKALQEPDISPSVQSSGLRAPLRTLSISSPYPPDSPGEQRRRLRKRDTTPPLRIGRVSPNISPPRKLNAFDVLVKAQKKKSEELKERPDLAEFFENEAAESDEEDAFGFVKKKDDEEEEGEDLDKNLEELVDDAEMDQKAIAEELVQEKYREQLEVQDQEDEKFHQGVIQGELRKKRRKGVGIDDSDEESDDDQNARARRAMKKARKDIEKLGADASTRAFAETYNLTIQDDDDDFAYLHQEVRPGDLLADRMPVDGEDEDYDEEDGRESGEVQRTITYDEIRESIRQRREEGIDEVDMDPTDVSWIEQEYEEDLPRVKTVSTTKARPRVQDPEQMDLAGMGVVFRKSANGMGHLSKQWYEENKMRNAGMSRSVGGSAITGHAKAKSKTGTGRGPLATKSASASTSWTATNKPRAAPSVLSVISDKSQHFA
ncbi:hypothetical protein CVT26_000843 [Gymnopilus dilepis]|uniref:DNA replication checkpoint mediator MRC1 domain-containing protein n=1 Tax=Gymnopilus dilepis TaxID=231916 RepID=A0A409YLE5_9AGAR|nr:hypothetical protein CVT26_000843 [Gymnopilus dilepis]